MAQQSGRDSDSTSLVIAAVRGLMVFMVPMAGVIGAYYSTRAAIEGDIRELRQRIEWLNESSVTARGQIERDLANLRGEFDRHAAMGVGGIPHPTGVVIELERINERLKRIEAKVMP